jgi:hypothetical protein
MIYQNPEIVVERVIGNREPIAMQILDMDGLPLDLTGRDMVFRLVRLPSGKIVVEDAEATLDDEETGKVSYTPEEADVAEAGRYAVYFLDVTEEPYKRWPYDGAKYVLNIKRETER